MTPKPTPQPDPIVEKIDRVFTNFLKKVNTNPDTSNYVTMREDQPAYDQARQQLIDLVHEAKRKENKT